MAKAPDPKEAGAELARAEQDRAAAAAKAERAAIVVWVSLDGIKRTLRYNDVSALDVRDLRLAGVDLRDVWRAVAVRSHDVLDLVVAAWWLAGRQAGVRPAEDLEQLMARTFASEPWVYHPEPEELEADTVDDAGPPPSGAGSGP